MPNLDIIYDVTIAVSWDEIKTKYSQLSACGHPAIADTRYYGQNPDPRQKL